MAVELSTFIELGELTVGDEAIVLSSFIAFGESVERDPALALSSFISFGENLAADAPITGNLALSVTAPAFDAAGLVEVAGSIEASLAVPSVEVAGFAGLGLVVNAPTPNLAFSDKNDGDIALLVATPAIAFDGLSASGDLAVSARPAVQIGGIGGNIAGNLSASVHAPQLSAVGTIKNDSIAVSFPAPQASFTIAASATFHVQARAPLVSMAVVGGAAGRISAVAAAPAVSIGGQDGMAVEAPAPRAAMSGVLGAVGGLNAGQPIPVLLVAGRGDLIGTLALVAPAPDARFIGVHSAVGQFGIEIPTPALAASLATGNIGEVSIRVQTYDFNAGGVQAYGAMSLRIPALVVEAIGGSVPAAFTYVAHAINLANGGVTDFVFAKQVSEAIGLGDGRVLLVGADGVYVMDGDTDDGTAIAASLRLAAGSLGGSTRKRPVRAFISLRGGGGEFKVQVQDGTIYSYPVEATGESGIHVERAKLGRGLDSAYVGFGYAASTPFEIDSIEVELEEKTTRVR